MSKYQVVSTAPEEQPAELRVRCSDWREARRLQRGALNGDAAVVQLGGADGVMDLSVEFPDGQRVSLRARLTGSMSDDAGGLQGVVVAFDLDESMRRNLEQVSESASLAHSDAERMEELARDREATMRPPRPEAATPRDQKVTMRPSGRGAPPPKAPTDHSGVRSRPADDTQGTTRGAVADSERPTIPKELFATKKS